MDGVKDGSGVYYWTDGSRYDGGWLADEMSGSGVFKHALSLYITLMINL